MTTTNKNANAIFIVRLLHPTDSRKLEVSVTEVSNSDVDVHRIGDLRRLLDVDLTLLEHTPRDKIEHIRIEWEGEVGLSPIGVVWCPRRLVIIGRPVRTAHAFNDVFVWYG